MKNIIKNTAILTVITLVAGVLLGLVYEVTKEPIALAKEKAKNEAYQTVMKDADTFDADDLLKEKDMARCYTAKYYPEKHLSYINSKLVELEKEDALLIEKLKEYPNQKTSLNRRKQIETQVQKLKKTLIKTEEMNQLYPQGIVLSSGMTICTKHRAWLVYGGNRTLLREAGANYAIKQYEIFDDKQRGYEFVENKKPFKLI